MAAAQAYQLAHRSAVAIVPDRAAWPAIQHIRCFADKSFLRWPPHLNLLYPFWEDKGGSFATAAGKAANALAGMAPFEVTLTNVKHFQHRGSCSCWLGPASPELLDLQSRLQAAFPECTDLSRDPDRGIDGFVPHLSLGQWRPGEAQQALQELQSAWKPLTFSVHSVVLLSRTGVQDPFSIRYSIPLGRGLPPSDGRPAPAGACAGEVNVPYIATVGPGPNPEQHGAKAAAYGIGALHRNDSVWYFGFGANMSRQKLEGKRNITALESVPGRVAGWRLAFNHRGGMGNIVRREPSKTAPSGPQAVHGLLHRLSIADFLKLAHMEHEYRPTEVEVEAYDGRGPVRAITFITPAECQIRDGLPPISRYKKLLTDGAREWQLDPEYAAWLNSLPSIDSRERGQDYYTLPDGTPLKGRPR